MTCLLGLVLTILVTLIPSLVAITILWWLDRYEKDPLWLLGVAFAWGAIPSAILSIITQVLFDFPLKALLGKTTLYSLAGGSVIAPITEESFKALILLAIFLLYRKEFDGPMDGILYGALVGFGFTFVEDVLYLMSALNEKGWAGWGTLAFLRVGLFTLNHSLFTGCTGLGLGIARISREPWKKFFFPAAGWFAAVSLHGMHNAFTTLSPTTSGLTCLAAILVDWMGAWVMLLLILLVVQQEKRWLEELLPEVQAGVITEDEYRAASRYRTRFAYGWRVLSEYGIGIWFKWGGLIQTIVHLAYKKHQKRVAGEGAATDKAIEDLRLQIAKTRNELRTKKR